MLKNTASQPRSPARTSSPTDKSVWLACQEAFHQRSHISFLSRSKSSFRSPTLSITISFENNPSSSALSRTRFLPQGDFAPLDLAPFCGLLESALVSCYAWICSAQRGIYHLSAFRSARRPREINLCK